jgi:DNA-binding transcriptional LysR family regulator
MTTRVDRALTQDPASGDVDDRNDPAAGAAPDLLAASFATSYAGVVAFLTVAAEGSFAKAGDRLGIGRSAVSRSVQKLETQLGVRLFLRTTRSTSLTREGELFYANCHPGMARIEKALEEMRDLREGPPRGPLRVCATVGFGRKVVAPLLKEFCAVYPDISLDLLLDDGPTDFTSDRVDVSFRNGRMEDSQVIAKQLIPMQMVVCASADYVRDHGVPLTPADLEQHLCVNFRFASGRIYEWEFKVDGRLQRVLPHARFTINDADLVLRAVRDGQGFAQMAAYQVSELLQSGELVSCLDAFAPDDRGHWICYQSRQHLPARIRVFIDFMTEKIRGLGLERLRVHTPP